MPFRTGILPSRMESKSHWRRKRHVTIVAPLDIGVKSLVWDGVEAGSPQDSTGSARNVYPLDLKSQRAFIERNCNWIYRSALPGRPVM
jgi:hypothetical protein